MTGGWKPTTYAGAPFALAPASANGGCIPCVRMWRFAFERTPNVRAQPGYPHAKAARGGVSGVDMWRGGGGGLTFRVVVRVHVRVQAAWSVSGRSISTQVGDPTGTAQRDDDAGVCHAATRAGGREEYSSSPRKLLPAHGAFVHLALLALLLRGQRHVNVVTPMCVRQRFWHARCAGPS